MRSRFYHPRGETEPRLVLTREGRRLAPRLLDHPVVSNSNREIRARLEESGWEQLPATLPWEEVEFEEVPEAPSGWWSAVDPIRLRLLLAEDAETGFAPDTRRINPDGTISREQRNRPTGYYESGRRMRRDTCMKGHDLNEPGARYPSGNCRACNREAVRRYHAKKRKR